MKQLATILAVTTALGFSPLVNAKDATVADQINSVEQQILTGKANLNTYFSYAKLAEQQNDFAKAAKAYRFMLSKKPDLQRVKLDLGLALVKLGKYKEAKFYFKDVLADKNIPDSVKQNIHKVLKVADKATTRHSFSGGFSAGYNHDTNANAAASSSEVTFFDQSIPLTRDSVAQADHQVFASANAKHRFRFSNVEKRKSASYWDSGVSAYRTEHIELGELELTVLGAEMGPVFQFAPIRTEVGLKGGYNYIRLDNKDYLRIGTAKVSLNHRWNNKVSVSMNTTGENRHFVNSPSNSTLSDRSGNAVQSAFTINYAPSKNHILGTIFQYRRENTRREYYDFARYEATLNYTSIITPTLFALLSAKAAITVYDGADPLVTSSRTRKEFQQLYNITLGKKLENNITATVGYQYNHVNADIQNYDYDNHRVTSSVGWRF